MSLTVDRADWAGLKRALNRCEPGVGQYEVGKLEPGPGGVLMAQLIGPAGLAWVRWNGESLETMNPADDADLPSAALLRERTGDPALEVLNYRPGRRLVVLDRRPRIPRIIKGYRRGRSVLAGRRYQAAHAACCGDSLSVPEVIDQDERRESLTFVYLPGPAPKLLSASKDIFYRIGKGLAAFQHHASDPCLEAFGSRDELDVVDRFVAKVRHVGLDLPAGWQPLRARLGVAERSLPPETLVLCHRDLHDRQLIVGPGGVTLLDFDLLCRAESTLDAANFLAHMVLRQLQGVPEAAGKHIQACGEQFLDGLGRNREPAFWERLRFYQASSFLRLALVYTLRPRWAGLAARLSYMGKRCLDDMERARAA